MLYVDVRNKNLNQQLQRCFNSSGYSFPLWDLCWWLIKEQVQIDQVQIIPCKRKTFSPLTPSLYPKSHKLYQLQKVKCSYKNSLKCSKFVLGIFIWEQNFSRTRFTVNADCRINPSTINLKTTNPLIWKQFNWFALPSSQLWSNVKGTA